MSHMGERAGICVTVFAATVLGVAPAHAGDTGIVNVSRTLDYSEGEEPLAINPVNPLEMVTVANVFQPDVPEPLRRFISTGGVQQTRVYSTRDGGLTWKTDKLDQGGLGRYPNPLPPDLGFAPEFSDMFNILNTDADAAFDRHGNAYFESGDVHGVHHNGDEVATVWRSTDAGLTWGPHLGYEAVNARKEGDELDRPWLAVDNSGGRHDGRLYITFETSAFIDDPPKVFIKHSDDHGKTWSKTVRVDDGLYETQFNPRARPVVGADGAVYVIYDRAEILTTPFGPQAGPIHVVVARSTDGGQSFERFEADTRVQRVESPDEATPDYTEMIGAIATHPKRPGYVAVAWPEALSPRSSRIMLRFSRDGGRTWGERVDIADDPADRVNQHDHVTLAWHTDGRLFAGWRDRRCCGGHQWDDDYQQFVRALHPADAGSVRLGRTVEFSEGHLQGTTGDGRGILQPDEFQGLVVSRIGVGLTWSQIAGGGLSELMFRRRGLEFFEDCATRRVLVRIRRPLGRRVVRAVVYADGRRVRVLRGHNLRRVAVKARYGIRIVAYARGGLRKVTIRRLSHC